ncbi:syntaxin-6-like [Physella acuta]|uniref:syntaxin-6-like n=1 Tax=Physella acuta TaxID=109671 RepID=UPI0027DE2D78|nr:syntaxin-6-like [Physella acuta]XP_059146456.1 syntaxin-6-like [Physella acuta]XP_059146458.1 syntaxin-6-like [Physella acuta]XP_059146459.1 syntaxin-6-like [Physella acuta]
MSVSDPFFSVKDEVQKALVVVRNLFSRWRELQENAGMSSREEVEYTTNELRNSLRSIEWDLEDLEETVGIVEKNPRKFKISEYELQERRNFVEKTKSTVRDMKSQISSPGNRQREEPNARQAFLTTTGNGPKAPQDKYKRLDEEMEQANQRYISDTQQQQKLLIKTQDDQLDMIGSSVGVLKNMSQQIGNELEDQNIMLDEFHHEMDNTESKMDQTMKKMAKVLHMSNDRRQWCAIGVLCLVLLIIIILFFIV